MPIIGSVLYMRLPYSDDSAVMTVSFHNGVALLKNVCHPVLSSVWYKKTTPVHFLDWDAKNSFGCSCPLMSLWATREAVCLKNKRTNKSASFKAHNVMKPNVRSISGLFWPIIFTSIHTFLPKVTMKRK